MEYTPFFREVDKYNIYLNISKSDKSPDLLPISIFQKKSEDGFETGIFIKKRAEQLAENKDLAVSVLSLKLRSHKTIFRTDPFTSSLLPWVTKTSQDQH